MLTEQGRVVAVDGDAVWVETLRSSACGSCSARSGCGHDLLNRVAAGSSRGIVRARRAAGFATPLAVHDSVTLALPERRFLEAATTLYVVPLLCTLAMALGANAVAGAAGLTQGGSDLAVVVGAATGLVGGLALARYLGHQVRGGEGFQPQITAKH
jgi:sigma-E factor negative regulatory protein RseC